MARNLTDGDELLLRGSAGALFRVTVGAAFTPADIAQRLRTGEWSYPDDQPADQEPIPKTQAPGPTPKEPESPKEPAKTADPNRPGVNDPKSDWTAYVAGLKHMSLEDASAYTKADLIEMAS